MKMIYRKWKLGFILTILFTLLLNSFIAFANVKHLMINTDSNALMTLELDDNDYSVFALPRSSISNVTNTVDYSGLDIHTRAYTDTSMAWAHTVTSDGSFKFDSRQSSVINGYSGLIVRLQKDALPQAGIYRMRFDFSSDFSFEYGNVALSSTRMINNVESKSDLVYLDSFQQNSGDLYFDTIIDIGSVKYIDIYCNFKSSTNRADVISGSIKINFQESDDEPFYSTLGQNSSSADYENDVSSSLSDLSSSVGEVSEEIGFVAEAIQNLQGAMEPHYNNVLTQLHHITEQLHAFYDQIYNNIHLKEYALWQDIKTAIENIDLEVNVNLDKLKTSIDNMSQAVQNKLQSVTDTITGGYNSSGMQEDNNELSGALDELDNAEQEVLDDVNVYIEGFEYPSFDGISSGIIGALSFFGGFLHSIFLGMGEFGLIITFSLTMIFVLIIVGYHRIRS